MRFAAIMMLVCSIAVAVGVFSKDWVRYDDSDMSLGPIGGVESCRPDCQSVSWDELNHHGISGIGQGFGMAVAFGGLVAAVTGFTCGLQLLRRRPAPVKPARRAFTRR